MVVLNLGCGSRTSPHCVNVDWSPYLRLGRSRFGSRLAPLVLRGVRRERFAALADDVVVHDLRRRLPFDDGSADAVYHSHVLEHIDRDRTVAFLEEIRRVLRVGGVHRVVVPDLEARCRDYVAHVDECLADPDRAEEHDGYVGRIIEQSVRRESAGSSRQPPVRRHLENLLLGDARRRGETHQWMFDRINLGAVLRQAGFGEVTLVDHRTSAIPHWDQIRLDELSDGTEYLPGSLYVEALK